MIRKSVVKPVASTELSVFLNNFGALVDTQSSDASLSFLQSTECYNFQTKSGALKNGAGFLSNVLAEIAPNTNQENVQFLQSILPIKKAWVFEKVDEENNQTNFLLVMNEEFFVFCLNLTNNESEFEKLPFSFSSEPEAICFNLNGEDVVIFCSSTDSMQVWNGIDAPYFVGDAPFFVSMCVHEERLFALTLDTKTLWFSDDLDPTNWSVSLQDAGFIQMTDERGALRKVVSWNGYVFVFRDYGISRLLATGFQETFSLSHLFVSSGKIYADTVCVCGDRILFLAEDGLYVFDGSSTTQILKKSVANIVSQNNNFAKAYFFGGKYFLACTAKFDDTKLGIQFDDNSNCTNNALLIVDADDLSFEIVRGIEVFEFCGVKHKSKLLVCARLVGDNQTKKLFAISNDGKCDDEVLKKVWVSAFCTLARPTKTKTLKKVCVLSNTNCVLHIKSELGKTQLNIFAGEFPREYIVHLKGKKFCVGFECNEFNNDMKIEELLLVFAQSDSK